jgi:hypothetical protein
VGPWGGVSSWSLSTLDCREAVLQSSASVLRCDRDVRATVACVGASMWNVVVRALQTTPTVNRGDVKKL